MSSYIEDDEERDAYQHFMLTGKIYSPEKRSSDKQDRSSSTPKAYSSSKKGKPTHHKLAQQVYTSIDAFSKLYVSDWLFTDDQLCSIVESIPNLRERIWIASRQMVQSELQKSDTAPWKHRGYRGCGTRLLEQDIANSLEHSLLAHERMSASLRQGLSRLHQAQEALGRRLDDVLAHMDTFIQVSALEKPSEPPMPDIGRNVEECIQIFRASAENLYQKQVMGQELLDSGDDDLFYSVTIDSGGAENFANLNDPRSVAFRTAEKWPRTWKESPFLLLEEVINGMKQIVQ